METFLKQVLAKTLLKNFMIKASDNNMLKKHKFVLIFTNIYYFLFVCINTIYFRVPFF